MEEQIVRLIRHGFSRDSWVLVDNAGTRIDEYKASEAITCETLMDKLIKEDLTKIYTLEMGIEDPEERENRLFQILNEIFKRHKEAVEKYEKFIERKE